MSRLFRAVSAAALVRNTVTYSLCGGSASTAVLQHTVRTAAETVGASVRDGSFVFWAPPSSCTDCGNANPLSPYAMATMAPSQGDTQMLQWPLAQTEVIAVWLCVPPMARYIGWTPYMMMRKRAEKTYTVFASMADTSSAGMSDFNSSLAWYSRLQSSAGQGALPWGHDAVLLLGSDTHAVAAARQLIEPLMVSAGGITSWIIPKRFSPAEMPGSTYSLLQRYALPANASAWAAWMTAPPVAVWSLTMPTNVSASDTTNDAAPLIPKRGFTELYLEGAVVALAGLVASRFNATGTAALFDASQPNPLESGFPCVQACINCGGDNRDTTYVTSLPLFKLPLGSESFAVLVGVNHARAGNGAYSSVSVYDSDIRLGVMAVTDNFMSGTANSWLKGTPHERYASKLYVIAVSRTCGPNINAVFPGESCMRVPSAGFPSVKPEHSVRLVERPYAAMDGSNVGPDPHVLVLPKLVLVNVQSYSGVEDDASNMRQRVASSIEQLRTRQQGAQQAVTMWAQQQQMRTSIG
jgi:hypothetical protein